MFPHSLGDSLDHCAKPKGPDVIRWLGLPVTSKNRWTFPIASPIVLDGCTERDQADLKAGCLDRSGSTALGRQEVRDSGFVCGFGLSAFRFP